MKPPGPGPGIDLPILDLPASALANDGPTFARLDGRVVVLMELAEYRDPDVAAFLRERFPRRETLAVLHAACVERFGPERAPSAGRIATLRRRWR